jgi:hypothetical protein
MDALTRQKLTNARERYSLRFKICLSIRKKRRNVHVARHSEFWWARPTGVDATLCVERWFVVVDSFYSQPPEVVGLKSKPEDRIESEGFHRLGQAGRNGAARAWAID